MFILLLVYTSEWLCWSRRYGPRCGGSNEGKSTGGCGLHIAPSDLVLRAWDVLYHAECLCCVICRRRPLTGDRMYALHDGISLACRRDFARIATIRTLLHPFANHLELSRRFNNKKAVLSQRWPRDACYISRSWAVAEIYDRLRRYGHLKFFQDGCGRYLGFVRTGNSAIRSAVPENRRPRKPYPRTKYEVDRITRCRDMAIRVCCWHMEPPFWGKGMS